MKGFGWINATLVVVATAFFVTAFGKSEAYSEVVAFVSVEGKNA